MGIQHNISTNYMSDSSPSLSSRKRFHEAFERYKKTKAPSSSTSSSPEIHKQKTANQILFTRECEELRKKYKSSDSNGFSSNTSNSYESQSEIEAQYNFSNPDDDMNLPTKRALHFKKPLINHENMKKFYEFRGRMEPIDWSVLNGEEKSDNNKKPIEVPRSEYKIQSVTQNNTAKVTAIKEQAKCKAKIDSAVNSFLQNTTTSRSIYKTQDNFKNFHHGEMKQNFKESSDSNMLNSSRSNSCQSQSETGRQCNFSSLNDDIDSHAEGVLHFKKPLINKENEKKFYESRGRMEPMDWTVLNGEKRSDNSKKKAFQNENKMQKVTQSKTTIKKQSDYKPEATREFLNFLQNTATSRTIYEVRNNFESSPMDLPTLTLKQMLKNTSKDFLAVTPQIKHAFESSQSHNHLIDLIDKPINKTLISTSKESCLDEKPTTTDTVSKVGVYNLTNGTQKKEIDEYNDDMFIFTKPSSISEYTDEYDNSKKYNFITSSSKHRHVDEYDDEMFYFPQKEVCPVNRRLVTSSNSEYPEAQSQFNRIENVKETKLNYSFDSDDLSIEAPMSEIDDSISKKSMTINYEAFKHKLKNTSSHYSPKHNKALQIKQEYLEDMNKKKNDQFITKEMRTAHYIMSNRNAFTKETNTVQVSNIKIFPTIQEPLLTPVSTRYFPKSLKNEKEDSDTRNDDMDAVTKKVATINILDSSNTEELPVENKPSSCNNSYFSQDLYLSCNNTTTDSNFKAVTNNNDENCDKSFNQNVFTDFEEIQDSISDKGQDDSPTTFYSCKYSSDTTSSIIIEEIHDAENSIVPHSKPTADNVLPQYEDIVSENAKNEDSIVPFSKSIADDIMDLYEDMISDAEFDVVNVNQFPPYSSIFNKLMEVKEAQKAIATGILDVNDPNFEEKIQAHVKSKRNDRAIGFDKTKCSQEKSDDHYPGIDASVSSIAENETSNSLLNSKESIFSGLKIDNFQLDNSVNNFYGKKPNSEKVKKVPSSKTGTSGRMEKIKNVLNKCRNNLKAKVVEEEKEVKKEEIKPSKRLQLLNDLKKRKAQNANNTH